jgi:hypothetical protein
MNAIIGILKDPAWWFSVVFVAMCVSIVSGLLTDRIKKWLSNVFSGLKSWRVKGEQTRLKLIKELISNVSYMHMEMFRCVFFLILCVWGWLSNVFVMAVYYYKPQPFPRFIPNDILLLLGFILSIFLSLLMYKLMRFVSVLFGAIREYKTRNDFHQLG